MALVFAWKLQGTTPTTIADTDKLQFAGAAFDDPIFVSSYNDSTHVKSSGGSDLSAANTPNNNKFISQTGGAGGKSQVQVNGGGTVLLDSLSNANASVKITVTNDSAVATSDGVFYTYDGSTPATPASGVDTRVAEIGDTNFTEAEGSGAAMVLDDQASNTTHNFYIAISQGPTATGLKTGKMRIELVIV
jgi:hypothetical protein